MTTNVAWGMSVDVVRQQWRRRFIDNPKMYRALLLGEQPFPITLGLKPPKSSHDILQDVSHFQLFVQQWRALAEQVDSRSCDIVWREQGFRSFSEQKIPTKIVVHSECALAQFIGDDVHKQWTDSTSLLTTLMSGISVTAPSDLRRVLIQHIQSLEMMSAANLLLLAKLIPQLHPNMGGGSYLRALPVVGVDTKFIEANFNLIEDIMDVIYEGAVKSVGLLAWLGCQEKPKDWLLVRPLCKSVQAQLGGLEILRLATETLLQHPLAVQHILIIENEQSCLSLGGVPDTIAVSGGGKNLSWLSADWLKSKRVAYWGDIDSEGFTMLSNARSKVPHLKSLMMDASVVERFQERMVAEPNSIFKEPEYLTESERLLFQELRRNVYQEGRLEQERIDHDYVQAQVLAWVRG